MTSRIGSVLDHKYEIAEEIGRGGMSTVYLAHDRRLGKDWAVKEYQRTGDERKDALFRKSLLAEARLMKDLDHPALPRIVDIIEADGTIFVVMDYIRGRDLASVFRAESDPIPEDVVADWGVRLCEVLDYLHTPNERRGKPVIVYRDMKPDNVMLRDDGSLCLVDFGIAREYHEEKLTDTTVARTELYAAPEQFDRSTQTDWRADIFSLGVTLYYLASGHNPNQGVYRPVRAYNPALSEGFEAVLEKCLQADREDRFQSARELAWALRHREAMSEGYQRQQRLKVRTFASLRAAAVAMLALAAVLALAALAGGQEWALTFAFVAFGVGAGVSVGAAGYYASADVKAARAALSGEGRGDEFAGLPARPGTNAFTASERWAGEVAQGSVRSASQATEPGAATGPGEESAPVGVDGTVGEDAPSANGALSLGDDAPTAVDDPSALGGASALPSDEDAPTTVEAASAVPAPWDAPVSCEDAVEVAFPVGLDDDLTMVVSPSGLHIAQAAPPSGNPAPPFAVVRRVVLVHSAWQVGASGSLEAVGALGEGAQ